MPEIAGRGDPEAAGARPGGPGKARSRQRMSWVAEMASRANPGTRPAGEALAAWD
ncbi:MAG: hypothetical protein ABSA16_02165 [Thermoguttaceae bacterium]